MKVLILGGTGAMGVPLQKYLLEKKYDIHITSRSKREDIDRVYHCGNGHDYSFLEKVLLKEKFDAVVDFLSYTTNEFAERADLILSNTDQYIFLSSARVYAPCEGMITEDCPRLLDVCEDKKYMKSDEYALAKARQEDILKSGKYSNWTIVRPSITYNSERMQYAIGEKEEWLYRYLNKEKIVFPQNLGKIYTTMSWGGDVARAISLLVGNEKSMGEAVHIAGAEPITWNDVNELYRNVLFDRFHKSPDMLMIDDWKTLGHKLGRFYQFKYARAINRSFDNSKLQSIVGDIRFVNPREGLTYCLNAFIDGGMKFKRIPCRPEAVYNQLTKDKPDLNQFTAKNRIKYMICRYFI